MIVLTALSGRYNHLRLLSPVHRLLTRASRPLRAKRHGEVLTRRKYLSWQNTAKSDPLATRFPLLVHISVPNRTVSRYTAPMILPQTETANNSFSLLPIELIVKILCSLPSFPDVFALSESCRRLQDIWVANVREVYRHIAPKCIPCERHARRFLASQGGLAVESPSLSTKDVVQKMNNAQLVKNAILQFEREIACRARNESFVKLQ